MICIIWLLITWVFPLLVFCGFPVRCIETYFHDLSSFQSLSLDPWLVFAVFSVARGWEDGVIMCWHSQVYWALPRPPPDLKVAASLVMRKVSLASFGGGFWVISTERSLWIPVHFHLRMVFQARVTCPLPDQRLPSSKDRPLSQGWPSGPGARVQTPTSLSHCLITGQFRKLHTFVP